jgi:putative glutamine amidotransferase
VADLDAVILTGGADVDPGHYGQQALPTTAAQPTRDAPELALLAAAEAAGVPVLGICRGAQVLNVARGGTLHQHVPDVLGHAGHQISAATFSDTSVSIVPRSRLAAVLGTRTAVRCYHHQAVDRLGRGLRIAATAADGTVEAVEAADPDAPFLLGVQWHPEESPADLRLFAALIDIAGERRSARRNAAEPKESTCPLPTT